jgi:sodium/hydrogen exchanger 10/11
VLDTGVLLGTAAIAILTKYTFPYHWTWTEALLFGSMMAATDPVATVAVLGEVQATPSLLHMTQGLPGLGRRVSRM